MITTTLLVLAVLLPWAVGAALVCACWYERQSGYWLAAVGMGFPLGMVSVILGYYLFGQLGYGVHLAPNLYLQLGLLLLLGGLARVRVIRSSRLQPTVQPDDQCGVYKPFARFLIWVVVSWLVIRLSGIFVEALLRPLFPWDAWTGLAVETKVWLYKPFHFADGTISFWPFPQVLWQGGTKHPSGLALIWLWYVQFLGRWDDALMNVAWPVLWGCMGLMLVGFMRLAGAQWPIAILTGGLFLSLPIAGINAVLAGYADLWIAGLMLVVSGLVYLMARRQLGFAIWILLIVAFSGLLLIKQHGLLWVLVAIIAVLGTAIRPTWTLAMVMLGAGILLLTFVFGDGRIGFGPFGSLSWSDGVLVLPGNRQFSGVWEAEAFRALLHHLLVIGNWHFLWYLVPVALIGSVVYGLRDRALARLSLLTWGGLGALFFLLMFTQSADNVIDGTSVNRLVLHGVPSLCLLLGMVVHRWREGVSG